jgi:hypothetical protein
MATEWFIHPLRFPKNADGPFYTTGYQCPETSNKSAPLAWCSDCLWCGAPELEAPDLLAPLTDENLNSYFIQQPRTDDEIERACRALSVCCTAAFRYGGKDRRIIQRLGNDPGFCDYIVNRHGELVLTIDESGELTPLARRIHNRLERRGSTAWQRFWNWFKKSR